MKSLLFCAALLTLLTACADPNQAIRVPEQIPVSVPLELRSCPGLPAVPLTSATQRDVAMYLGQLHQVATTCKVRLDSVDDILTDYEAGF